VRYDVFIAENINMVASRMWWPVVLQMTTNVLEVVCCFMMLVSMY